MDDQRMLELAAKAAGMIGGYAEHFADNSEPLLDDPCANLTLTTSEIIWELKAQVEKLTKERDALKTVPMKYRRMQFNAELQEEVTQLQEQLAALAEQNEKMKYALENHAGNYKLTKAEGRAIDKILELPNLATPVLNRIRAEGMRMAAEIVENTDVYTFVHGGRSYDDGGITLSAAATAIRAKVQVEYYALRKEQPRIEWLESSNAELCGGPSGPSERAPCYASAPKTEE